MISWDSVSAFGDEAAESLEDQVACLQHNGIGWLELRSAWGRSVLALPDDDLRRARRLLDAAGVGVSAVGSPVGKVPVTDPWEVTETMLERACAAAGILGTRRIRMFSFFVDDPAAAGVRDRVLDHLGRMAAIAGREGLVLVHENEKGIFGDTPERCADIHASIASASLRACFDVANFIQVGVRDIPAAWRRLAADVDHIHVKDALDDGTVVPAGHGLGQWPWLLGRLRERRYAGFLTLEPHLEALAGCERLSTAADALRTLLGAAVMPAGA